MANPLDGFTVTREDLWFIGEGLHRPECLLAEPDGSLWSCDARGGVVHIRPDGSSALIVQALDDRFGLTPDEAERFARGTLPRGLAFDTDGSVLIANAGTDRLERMTRDGRTSVVLDTIDGTPVGRVNCVLRDRQARIWLTISTRLPDRMAAISPRIADGYIAILDNDGARIVADGFAFPGEIRFDAAEDWLYVAETTGRRVTRLRIGAGAQVQAREIFGPADTGGFINGMAFDAFGNLWGTQGMSDRLFALTPDGEFRVLLEDGDSAASAALHEAFARDAVTPNHLLACGGTIAPGFASLTFGGADLRDVHIGSLRGDRIAVFRSPVPGQPLAHWR